MAILISTITEPNGTVVKVDGRLQVNDVEELKNVLQGLPGPLELDLADLQGVDRSVIALLRDLIEMGVAVRAASPYVRLLLENASPPSQPRRSTSIPRED